MTSSFTNSFLVIGGLALGLSSCAVDKGESFISFPKYAKMHGLESAPSLRNSIRSVDATSKYYSKGHYVYVNESVLDTVNSSNARIEIDLSEQRVRLYNTDGGRQRLALVSQISTGNSSHPSPTGNFRISEKSITKESNLYGDWVDSKTGNVLVSGGDSREPPSDKNASFRGSEMPYWLRLTGDGVGMHIGYVPNGPASHGCIRVPRAIQPTLYRKVRIGTPVSISN